MADEDAELEVKASERIMQIRELVRTGSLSRMKIHSQCEDFEIEERDDAEERCIYDHWMSLILISGGALRITFKAHFNSKSSKIMASRAYGIDPEEVSQVQAQDFIKEFCNLTAGYLKKVFEDSEMNVGISLPLVIRGFDEVFFQVSGRGNTITDTWVLEFSNVEFTCSSVVEVLDMKNIAELNLVEAAEEDDDGDIDFL